MRRLMTTLATAALVVAAGLTGASPASAATCSGTTCNGKNPSTTGCSASGTSTVATADLGYDWKLEMRYSSICKTYWARVTGYHHVADVGANISVDRSNPYISKIDYHTAHLDRSHTTAFTNMWGQSKGFVFRVCLSFDQGSVTKCTSWRS